MNRAIYVILGVLLLGTGLVMAVPSNATVGTVTDLTRWEPGPTDNVTTEGGNISRVNITSDGALTDKWAGFYGNLTAAGVYLTDNVTGTTSPLYQWNGSVNDSYICLSQNTNFDWPSSTAATGAEIDNAATFNFNVSDVDSGTNTVSGACSVEFLGIGTIVGGLITHTSGTFTTCVIEDGTAPSGEDDFAFCVDATDGGTSYTGDAASYEVMVATTENDGAAGPTETYYVYVEVR